MARLKGACLPDKAFYCHAEDSLSKAYLEWGEWLYCFTTLCAKQARSSLLW
ncbi:hypothetical protein BCE02nite_27830 [Brevibacillus centrosporus]|nr:hypothetical protein BCE02nite_27830 [Brevibacillus centrosporus]